MAYGFDAERLFVWLAVREPDSEPMHAGSLCLRHADAMVVPRGWTLDDRREPSPRLFRPAPTEHRPRERSSRPPHTAANDDDSQQLPLPAIDGTTLEGGAVTVAAVAGPSKVVDPDATVAIPWLPEFDDDDDLGGILSADSPLLARAFRGADRPRDP